MEQALADYAIMITELKQQLGATDCPAIVFGGRYDAPNSHDIIVLCLCDLPLAVLYTVGIYFFTLIFGHINKAC